MGEVYKQRCVQVNTVFARSADGSPGAGDRRAVGVTMDGQSLKARVLALFREHNMPVDPALIGRAFSRCDTTQPPKPIDVDELTAPSPKRAARGKRSGVPAWLRRSMAVALLVVCAGCDYSGAFVRCHDYCAEHFA